MSRHNYDNFERKDIMNVCYGMIKISDELWIFGLGSGSLDEFEYARKIIKPTESFIKQFDPEWEEYSKKEKYHKKYPNTLKEVLSP